MLQSARRESILNSQKVRADIALNKDSFQNINVIKSAYEGLIFNLIGSNL